MTLPKLSIAQGAAIQLLDALSKGRLLPEVPPNVDWSEDLVSLGMQRLSIHAHRHLLTQGGLEERTVLRPHRVQGRFFDEALNTDFSLRFTRATLQLWMELARLKVPNASELGSDQLSQQRIHKLVRIADTDTGDWLFFSMFAQGLDTSGIPVAAHTVLSNRLAKGSPLTALQQLRLPFEGNETRFYAHLKYLTAPNAVRLLEVLQTATLKSWIRALERAFRPPRPGSNLEEWGLRVRELGRVLDLHLNSLEAAHRLDLALGMMRLLAHLGSTVLTGPANTAPQTLLQNAKPKQISERATAMENVADLLSLAARFTQIEQRFIQEGYAGARYEEGQLFLRDYEQWLAPRVEHLGDLERVFRGIVS